MKDALLKVVNLQTHLQQYDKTVYAVDGVDFEILRGENLGLVGESGCGKTMTALSIMGLVPGSPGVVNGEIYFDGQNLLDGLPSYGSHSQFSIAAKIRTRLWLRHYRNTLKEFRGKKIGMVFQEPSLSLDPLQSVGSQIVEVILAHSDGMSRAHWWQLRKLMQNRRTAYSRTAKQLDKLGIDAKKLGYRPYELSGGMQQRIAIAAALAGGPSLLIADEPTTALDVTIQAKVLHLLQEIKKERGGELSIFLIGHDIGVISALADKVAVMYRGRIMEYGESSYVLNRKYKNKHPYTSLLLEAADRISGDSHHTKTSRDIQAKGPKESFSDNTVRPIGCRFIHRCRLLEEGDLDPDVQRKCRGKAEPEEFSVGEGHRIRCWKWERWSQYALDDCEGN